MNVPLGLPDPPIIMKSDGHLEVIQRAGLFESVGNAHRYV